MVYTAMHYCVLWIYIILFVNLKSTNKNGLKNIQPHFPWEDHYPSASKYPKVYSKLLANQGRMSWTSFVGGSSCDVEKSNLKDMVPLNQRVWLWMQGWRPETSGFLQITNPTGRHTWTCSSSQWKINLNLFLPLESVPHQTPV